MTAARQAGASAAPPADAPAPAGEDRPVAGPAFWLGVALASVLVWAVLTWPLPLHLDHFWTMKGNRQAAAEPNFTSRPGAVMSGDFMQTVFIQSVVVDNARDLRNPYLDLREGTAGLTELRTTSLDLPWTPVFALLWPLLGMVPAYNLILLLATVATGLAAFGWLRRHLRWPLLAAAGALAYTFTPNRMFQLTVHFNAVLWWAFPAALWAFEVMVERHRDGRRWRGPAAGVAAVALTVAVSGEYHLTLYLSALLTFMVVWALVSARVERRPLPLAPAAVTLAAVAAGALYVVTVFRYAFKGTVAGENGSWQQVVLYAPDSLFALVRKTFGTQGEELLYVGWPLLLLAVAGLAAVVAGCLGRAGLGGGQDWRQLRAALPYAALTVPLVFLTYGPRSDIGPLRPYRLLFDNLPFLSLQRVPERLMCVTALMLVFLAVTTLDLAARRWPGRVDPALAGEARAQADAAAADTGAEHAGGDELAVSGAERAGDDAASAVGSGLAGGDAVAADTSGPDRSNLALDQPGAEPPGTGQVGPGEPGSATPDPGQLGPGRPGSDQPGPDELGHGQGGHGQPGLGMPEPVTASGPAFADEVGRPDWIVAHAPATEAEAARPPAGATRFAVPERLRPWLTPGRVEAQRLAVGALVLATLLLLADYRVSENRVQPGLADNKVVAALRSAGDQAGPVLGLPALPPQVTWNSASTYLAAQSRRRVLNAYNQTPARWLDDRMDRLEPLNRGLAHPISLEVLRTTGTRQVLVVDEPRVFAPGQWELTIGALVRSGAFRLVEKDGPLALLELAGGQSPTQGNEQPGPGSDPTRQV